MFIVNPTMTLTGNIRLALYSEDNLLAVFDPDNTICIQRTYEANINLPKLELRKEMCISKVWVFMETVDLEDIYDY